MHPRHAQVFACAGGGRSAFRQVASSPSRSLALARLPGCDDIPPTRDQRVMMSVVRKSSTLALAISVSFVDLSLGETAAPSRAPSEPVGKNASFLLSFSLSLSHAPHVVYHRPSVYTYVTPLCRRRRRSRHAATHSALPRNVSFRLDGRSSGCESTSSNLTFERPVAFIVDAVREKTFVLLDSASTTVASTCFACQVGPV